MDWPTINPLCDKDRSNMSPKDLTLEFPGEAHVLTAYVCETVGCNRCYSEAAGYFDFIAGKPVVGPRQVLCEADARAMYLESISTEGYQSWRCPECRESLRI